MEGEFSKTCATCRHFSLSDLTDIQAGKGECRRFPPQFFIAPDPRTGFGAMCGYAQVSRKIPACGEHAGKLSS